MIERILPPQVTAVERWIDCKGTLFPEEELLMLRAVPKRIAEFTMGRTCAREALGLLGVPPVPIMVGVAREPIWPENVVGSITHCQGYCAAAVARSTSLLGMGIDAELNEPLPTDVRQLVFCDDEIALLQSLPSASAICCEALLFSAKESLFKAWYPINRCWLDFKEAVIHLEFTNMSFAVTLHNKSAFALSQKDRVHFTGHFTYDKRFILTAVIASYENGKSFPDPPRS